MEKPEKYAATTSAKVARESQINSELEAIDRAVSSQVDAIERLFSRTSSVLTPQQPGNPDKNCKAPRPVRCDLAEGLSIIAERIASNTARIEELISRCEL